MVRIFDKKGWFSGSSALAIKLPFFGAKKEKEKPNMGVLRRMSNSFLDFFGLETHGDYKKLQEERVMARFRPILEAGKMPYNMDGYERGIWNKLVAEKRRAQIASIKFPQLGRARRLVDFFDKYFSENKRYPGCIILTKAKLGVVEAEIQAAFASRRKSLSNAQFKKIDLYQRYVNSRSNLVELKYLIEESVRAIRRGEYHLILVNPNGLKNPQDEGSLKQLLQRSTADSWGRHLVYLYRDE